MRFDFAHQGWQRLLDILYPENCVGCDKDGTWLCSACISLVPRAIDNQENMHAVFDYRDTHLRAAIHKLKYKRGQRLAPILGMHLAEMLLEDLADYSLFNNPDKLVIVPAPLTKERMRERGFNQAELIAEVVAQIVNLPLVTDALVKVKHTPAQVSLKDKQARLSNLRNAFSVIGPELVTGRDVILIDDVYTTGATAGEIMRVLKRAGARSTLTYTVAH